MREIPSNEYVGSLDLRFFNVVVVGRGYSIKKADERNYLCVKYQGCTHDMINDFQPEFRFHLRDTSHLVPCKWLVLHYI